MQQAPNAMNASMGRANTNDYGATSGRNDNNLEDILRKTFHENKELK